MIFSEKSNSTKIPNHMVSRKSNTKIGIYIYIIRLKISKADKNIQNLHYL